MNPISTFDINKEPLLDLLQDIKQGKIQLADFQRSWCWFEHGYFPVSQVFQFPQWRSHYSKYWNYNPEKLALIEQFEAEVIKKFEHYQMGLFVLRSELPKEAVCYIFEENNKRQCELNQFDLLTSCFAASEFDLRQDWAEREYRFLGYPVLRLLKPTDFLQATTLIASYSRRQDAVQQGSSTERLPGVACNRQDVLRLDPELYQYWAEPLTEAFQSVARFLHTQAIFDADDLPYPMQVVVMAPLFAILGEQTQLDGVRNRLKQWFYCGAASGIYSRSREANAAKDLIEVPQWLNGGEAPITIKESHVSSERLQSLVSVQSSAYRAISALLRRDGALDFASGEPITSARYFDEKIENHHIFPRDWCKRQGISRHQYNSIVNKTPLTAKTNKFLRGSAPSEYLAKLEQQGISRQRIDEILLSHYIDPATLRNNDFENFFAQRTQALLEIMGQAMGKTLTVDIAEKNGQRWRSELVLTHPVVSEV